MELKVRGYNMISFGITVFDEYNYLIPLLEVLIEHKGEEDEIVVLADTKSPKKLYEFVNNQPNVSLHTFTFDKNYADLKNYLNSVCTKEWIFQIDCDEIPHPHLIEILPDYLATLEDEVELVFVPRINTYDNITPEFIAQHHLQDSFNQRGWLDWPDYCGRIYKNHPTIKWEGRIHETIQGYILCNYLTASEEYSLIHRKTIDRQEKQNEFYNTFDEHRELAQQIIERRIQDAEFLKRKNLY